MTTDYRICKTCGQPTKLMLPPGGNGPRSYQCITCDRPDPIRSPQVKTLLKALASEGN